MAQQDTRAPAVAVLRWQAVRTFSNGAVAVVAAFETEEDAELFADEMFLRRGAEVMVRRDPILAARDAEVRRLIRRATVTEPGVDL